MTSSVAPDLFVLIADWLKQGKGEFVDIGMSRVEAGALAIELLTNVGGDQQGRLDARHSDPDVLYAALEILQEKCMTDPAKTLRCASGIWNIIKSQSDTTDELGEYVELLCSFSFVCWRAARGLERAQEKYKWETEYRSTFRASLQWEINSSHIFGDRREPRMGFDRGSDSENVFKAVMFLQDNCDAAPETIGLCAVELYRILDSSRASIPADLGSFLTGCAARIAGAAMRQSGVPDEASEWLDLAEAEFRGGPCARAELAKVAYQRLALLYRLSRFDLIEGVIPAVDKTFVDLGMQEDYFKGRVLWASSLKIAGRCDAALDILEPLREKREEIPPALYGWILLELGDLHQIGGDYERGIADLTEAAELLRDSKHFTGLADVTSMLASAYRAQGMLNEAIELFQKGRQAYAQLGMKSLEAYIRILLAETFLAMGKLVEAEREIIAAFPTLQEQRMLAEATAGLGLLREVARRRRFDPTVAREQGMGPRKL